MVRSIRGFPILQGVRGKKGVDLDSLTVILLKISQLTLDFPRIEEMDLNPIFCFEQGKGCKVVDVRIKLGSAL
jgi:acyl-CoA synthetase (NDP forming)